MEAIDKEEKTITNNYELDDISQVHQEVNDSTMVQKSIRVRPCYAEADMDGAASG